jgi:hypothetical protein
LGLGKKIIDQNWTANPDTFALPSSEMQCEQMEEQQLLYTILHDHFPWWWVRRSGHMP